MLTSDNAPNENGAELAERVSDEMERDMRRYPANISQSE